MISAYPGQSGRRLDVVGLKAATDANFSVPAGPIGVPTLYIWGSPVSFDGSATLIKWQPLR